MSRGRRRWPLACAPFAYGIIVIVVLVWAMTGCGRSLPPPVAADAEPGSSAATDRPAPRPGREKMLASVLTVLDRMDDFDEARGAELVFDRLNQWIQASGSVGAGEWRPDPLLATLPARLREPATDEALAASAFTLSGDVVFLRDQRWLADIARVARAGAVDDLTVAENLFRWTVRSLAIVADPPMVPTAATPGGRWFLPGEILLAGRASGPQRAWIFLELLRHAGLDGVMLATGDAAGGTLRPWLPAVIIDGEAYLFEPTYGMPVPGPGNAGVATVRQATADPTILAALSLPDRPYPVQIRDMAGLSVLVAADPWSLARRMDQLDRHLRAAREMRVAVVASRLAATATKALSTAAGTPPAAHLWEFPWETLVRRGSDPTGVQALVRRELATLELPVLQPVGGDRSAERPLSRPLFAARLREFRGDVEGADGAKAAYLAARPGRDVIRAALEGVPQARAAAVRNLYGQMKEDATYWLGVLMLAEGDFATAVDYLGRMTLEAAPDSRWADAARTNLAQALIGLGRPADAMPLLVADVSPQRYGSRLLAARLAAAMKTGDGTP